MSTKIHILDETVSNQIAAGEVVERPASVVKELVENALDAAARRIDVDLEASGLSLIRVTDDGEGMGSEDLQLAIKRHATSKLKASRDLLEIESFGFRGEALPSIASISNFSAASKEKGASEGFEIKSLGGVETALEPSAVNFGTRIEVRDLFFNTPARRKFLKSASTESGRVQQDLIKLALPQPEVSFSLRLDKKLSIDFPRVKNLRERVGQALGTGFLSESLAIEFEAPAAKVRGWAGLPGQHRSNRSGQYLFINKRAVEHRLLGFTLSQAYGSLIPHGRHAVAILFLELNPSELDVNVHPAKREVRFRDERAVLDAIRHALGETLSKASLMAAYDLSVSNPRAPMPSDYASYSFKSAEMRSGPSPLDGILQVPGLASHEISAALAPHQTPSQWMSSSQEASKADWPVPLAQLHRSYILCQESGGLVVVDQHAAHERVLYERQCRALENGDLKSQRLLLPQKLSPGPTAAVRLRSWMEALASLGLELQDLGGDVFYLLSIPSFMKNVQVPALLQDLLDVVGEELEKDPLDAFRREIAAQMACKAAIKAGDSLNLEEMQHLMSDLSRCEIPWSCPHGRPPLVRLPLEELEKYFERR